MKQSLFCISLKEIYRSSNFGKSLATSIMLLFLGFYFLTSFLTLGFFIIPELLADKFPGQELTDKLNSYLLIYFAFDLLFRQLLQTLPTIGIKPMLVLPIRREKLAGYLLRRSVFNFFNLLPFFLIVPLFFRVVVPEQSGLTALAWLVAMSLLILSNHYLTTYLKWWINESSWGLYVFMALFVGLYAVNYFGLISLTGLFGSWLDAVLVQPLLLPVFLVLPVFFYMLSHRYLKRNMYLDLVDRKQKNSTVRDFSWLARLGDSGKFISLDVRMILRNKRPRIQFFITVLFLAYGFLIYNDDYGETIPEAILILGGIIMTGMFSISIGQFFPAWHSRYYAMLMTQNFKMKQFLQSFYYMNVVVSFIYFLVTLLYAFIDIRILYFNTALFFYHIGVNLNLVLLFGIFSKKAVDLGGSAVFNYQGMGASQWLISFPLLLGPILLFYFFKLLGGSIGSLLVLTAIGVVGVLLQPYLFNYFEKAYKNQKYRMISDYKNS